MKFTLSYPTSNIQVVPAPKAFPQSEARQTSPLNGSGETLCGMPGNARSRGLHIESLVNGGAEKASTEVSPGDIVSISSVIPKLDTGITHHMRDLKARREWSQRPGTAAPRLDSPHVVEAIMIHERGTLQADVDSCSRCRRGEGISHECISVPDIPWCCSNCLYDLSKEPCDATPLPLVKESDEERGFWENVNEMADRSFVLALVAQIQRRAGHGVDESPTERAEQIEQAAMTVSRLAGQWRRRQGRRESS